MPDQTLKKNSLLTWLDLIPFQPQEFALSPLERLEGQIPDEIQGSLYRNGPTLLERQGRRVGHLFDGDGAILAVHLNKGQARATYRYIHTQGYLAEEKAGRFLYNGYGMVAPGPYWNRFLYPFKNTANTSVLALEHKLLALWEGGYPYALNPYTLETIGLDSLGQLQGNDTYSAHPKVETLSGTVYNFGISYGKDVKLGLYASDSLGQIQQKNYISLSALGLGYPTSVHDFCLAGDYLVFFISPVRLRLWPLLGRQKPLSECMQWKPELGTTIIIIDRHSLELISHRQVESWYQWHYGNGYVNAQGEIILDLVRYQDFRSHDYLRDVVRREVTPINRLDGTLWRMRLEPKTAEIIVAEEVCERFGEFPVVDPRQVGQEWRSTYWLLHRKLRKDTDLLHGSLGRFQHDLNRFEEFDCGTGFYPMEPVFIPNWAQPAGQGWLITVILNMQDQRSEVWLFKAQALEAGPICRLALPQMVPLGFHGNWRTDSNSRLFTGNHGFWA